MGSEESERGCLRHAGCRNNGSIPLKQFQGLILLSLKYLGPWPVCSVVRVLASVMGLIPDLGHILWLQVPQPWQGRVQEATNC